MPPKNNKKGGNTKRKDDDEALLAAFEAEQKKQAAEAAGGKAKAAQAQQSKDSQGLTLADRKAKHAEEKRQQDAQRAKATEAQMLQAQAQQRMQQMMQLQQLRQLMTGGGGGNTFGGPMSPFLKEPKKDVTRHEFAASKTAGIVKASCVGDAQGWRRNMEDAHFIKPDFHDELALIGVFDGHAGKRCAEMCAMLLPLQLTQQMDEYSKKHGNMKFDGGSLKGFLDEAFPVAFQELDKKLQARDIPDGSGSTAVTVGVTKTHVICASVGDSRAVVCAEGGVAVALSEDHKPQLPKEKERIEKAGGHVPLEGQAQNRVNGELAMSRALGDFRYKQVPNKKPEEQLVTAVPDVMIHERRPGDEFLLVACDGLFDVMTNDMAIKTVRACLKEGKSLAETVEIVVQACVAPPDENGYPSRMGTDNVTLVITML